MKWEGIIAAAAAEDNRCGKFHRKEKIRMRNADRARGHKLQVLSDHNERNYFFFFQSVPPLRTIFFSLHLSFVSFLQFCYDCYFGTEQCVRFRGRFCLLKNASGRSDDFHKGNSNVEWNNGGRFVWCFFFNSFSESRLVHLLLDLEFLFSDF